METKTLYKAGPHGKFYWRFILLIVLSVIERFFSATEMSMVSLNRSRVRAKLKEGDKNTFVFLAFWNSPTISYHYSGGDHLDYHLILGQSLCR